MSAVCPRCGMTHTLRLRALRAFWVSLMRIGELVHRAGNRLYQFAFHKHVWSCR